MKNRWKAKIKEFEKENKKRKKNYILPVIITVAVLATAVILAVLL